MLPCRADSSSRAVPDALAARIVRDHIDALAGSCGLQETTTTTPTTGITTPTTATVAAASTTSNVVLVDGFPRTPGQLQAWLREKSATSATSAASATAATAATRAHAHAHAAVFLVCSKEACLRRVGGRGANDRRRPDDAIPERSRERVERFLGNLEPLRGALKGEGVPVVQIDAEREVGLVVAETRGVVKVSL